MLDSFDDDPVLCHNDLNPQNILWKHYTPILLDWEYAGSNDRYFDLACVVVEFELNRAESRYFLDTYFQSDLWDQKKLIAYIHIYHEVCAKWWDDRS